MVTNNKKLLLYLVNSKPLVESDFESDLIRTDLEFAVN